MTLYDLRGKELFVGDKQVGNIYLGTKGIRVLKPKRYSPSLILPGTQLYEFDYMSPNGKKLPDTTHTGTYSKNGYMQKYFNMSLNGTTGVTSRPSVGNTFVYEYILSRKNDYISLSSIMYLDYNLSNQQVISIFQKGVGVYGGYAFANRQYGEPYVTMPSKDKFFIIHLIQRVTNSRTTYVKLYINGQSVADGSINITSGEAFQRPVINASGSQTEGITTEMRYSSRYDIYLKEVAVYDFGGTYTESYASLVKTNYERAKELYN